jgi:hypothetical protein
MLVCSISFPFYAEEETTERFNAYKILWLNSRSVESISENNLKLLTNWGFYNKYKSWIKYYKDAFGSSLSPEQERSHRISVVEKQKILSKKETEFLLILSENTATAEYGQTKDKIVTKLDLFEIKEKIEKGKLDYYFILCSTEFEGDKKNPVMWLMPTFQHYAGKNKVAVDYCFSATLPKHPTEVSFTYEIFAESWSKKDTSRQQYEYYEELTNCLLEAMGEDNKIIVINLRR